MSKKVETVPDGIIKPTQKKRKPERVNRPDANYEKTQAATEFKCSACGNIYTNQALNFAHSNSPFYTGNNHRLTICNKCLDSFMTQYLAILGTQDDALRRMCLHLDIYLDEKILSQTRVAEGKQSSSRIKRYISNLNLGKEGIKTYDDYLAEQRMLGIYTDEDFDEFVGSKTDEITKDDYDFWGPGYTVEEMIVLKNHYDQLSKQRTDENSIQEVYIRDMCEIKVLEVRAREKNDIDALQKLKKLYQETAKNGGMSPKSKKDIEAGTNEKTIGEQIAMIENYCPAEFYKDKKLFKDFDGLGKYFERFILRPLKNLLLGTKELDPEFILDDG